MTDPIATSSIVAQAFRLMEKSPISSFADDSEEARAASEQYPVALDMCLEACDWSFASILVDLPELAALPDGVAADARLPYSYQLPGTCVVVREVVDTTAAWRRDGMLLRADAAGPLQIRYTARVQDETTLPATFRVAVSYQLAALLAPVWVGTASKGDRLAEGVSAHLKAAMRHDAALASPVRYDGLAEAPDWVTEARR